MDTISPTLGYRHGRVPREVRIGQVLDLAQELFAERGFAATSMDELARRAGVSKPVIYDLVGNKEALFRSCMTKAGEDLTDRIARAVADSDDARERFFLGAQAWFEFVAHNRGAWDGILSLEGSPLSDEVAAIRRRQAGLVADMLGRDLSAEGVDAPRPLLEAVAYLVNGALESLAAWWAEHEGTEPAALAALCTQIVYPGLESLVSGYPDGFGGKRKSEKRGMG